jgi:predicted DNA-binding transcriptional regulator AlpA
MNSEGSTRDDFLKVFLSKQDVAAAFGVSVRTVERWVRLRQLPAPVRLGRVSLFHVPTLREFLASDAKRSLDRMAPNGRRRGKW